MCQAVIKDSTLNFKNGVLLVIQNNLIAGIIDRVKENLLSSNSFLKRTLKYIFLQKTWERTMGKRVLGFSFSEKKKGRKTRLSRKLRTLRRSLNSWA